MALRPHYFVIEPHVLDERDRDFTGEPLKITATDDLLAHEVLAEWANNFPTLLNQEKPAEDAPVED